MRATADRLLRVWLAPALLIIAAGLFGAFRPVFRFHSQRPGQSGMHHPILLSETTESSADDQHHPAGSAALTNRYVSAALLALLGSLVTIVLKVRQTAFVPIAIRRLKLPRAAADSSPSS